MPRATVSHETTRIDLKTCPGGYVLLRTLTFHEMNTRQDIATRMYQEQTAGKKNKKRDSEEVVRGYLEVMNVAVTEYEFRNCITEHNLYVDDEETTLIDFTKPMQHWRLDPKIGQEIDKAIEELNQLDEEDEDDLGPLSTARISSFSEESSTPSPTSASVE